MPSPKLEAASKSTRTEAEVRVARDKRPLVLWLDKDIKFPESAVATMIAHPKSEGAK